MLHFPYFREESVGATMQRIRTVIEFQLVWLPIQLKLSLGNPVTIPAHDGAVKPFARLLISRQIGVTQHHVNKASMLIRNMQAHHTGTVIGNRRYHFAVGKRIQFDGITRSEERRVGKEGGRTCRSRWSPYRY